MKIQVYILLTMSLAVSSRDYDDDEGRPYEFGFTIDGQQHRRESKDVNGIIMGEFGFITADGIYHVTVYATDENGSFKILSMKNIRVSGPLDEPGYEFPSKTAAQNSAQISTTSTTTTTVAPINVNAPYVFTTLPSLNKPSCGSCKLPSTTPRPPGASNKLPFQTPQFQNKPQGGLNVPQNIPPYNNNPVNNIQANVPVKSQGATNYPGGSPQNIPASNIPESPHNIQTSVPRIELDKPEEANDYPGGINIPQNIPRTEDNLELFGVGKLEPRFESKPVEPSIEQQPPFQNSGNNDITSNSPYITQNQNYPDQKTYPSNIPSKFPEITVSNNQITIPGKEAIEIKDRYPNMKNGLPDGITENDMLDLLYKFNYTLGFHGHHEKGLKNGAKIGAYFVNGRDGIMRVVEYIADENGYRPKVKFINLGLDSPDTPKEGSEKKFGLKGFEFVWFPV